MTFSCYFNLYTQNPTDCIDAVIVCGNSNINLDVQGIGTQELSNSNTCGSQETNSLWLKVNIASDGTLGFTLKPNSTDISEDYDFFIFGPNVSCGNIGQAIRCSTTNPQSINQSNNHTGMNGTETDTSEGPGTDGNSFVQWMNVRSGDSYFIVIDRPIGQSGFSLEWTGTATFFEPPTNESPRGTSMDLENCDAIAPLDDNRTLFDLSLNTNLIIGNQQNVNVSYHNSESDANLDINVIGDPKANDQTYTNTANPQTIYARIENTLTGCFSVSNFELRVLSGANYTTPTNFVVCDNDLDGDKRNGFYEFDLQTKTNEILGNRTPSELEITYHTSQTDADNDINSLPSLYTNMNMGNQTIYVRIEETSNTLCYSTDSFELLVNPLPEYSDVSLFQCDEDGVLDGFTLFNLTESHQALTNGFPDRTTKFFLNLSDAQNSTNEIDGSQFYNTQFQQNIYVQIIDDITGCFDIAELTLDVSATSANNGSLFLCDNDGIEDGLMQFDLTQANIDVIAGITLDVDVNYYATQEDALLEVNELPTNFSNTTPYNQTIFVRVENDNDCFGINEVELTVFELPKIEDDEELIYCLNSYPETITLNAGKINDEPSNYHYLWSTGETTYKINVNQPGNYQVTTINPLTFCEKSRTISVLPSNIAAFDNIKVVDATSNNTIAVFVSGEGDYEYSFNNPNGPYQDSNFFENVPPGLHNVYVRDKNNCGTVSNIVSVIGFPRFFTPNNDSYHDTWHVYGINDPDHFDSKVYIFDRFGKLLKELSPRGPGWDGTFNGNIMPANDYWFFVKLQDGRVFRNHFTLKR